MVEFSLMRKLLAITCLVFSAAGSPADAQSFFVEGAAFASIERRAQTDSPAGSSTLAGVDGTVAGGGASVGAWLTPHISVRLEMSFPAGLESSVDDNIGLPIPVTFPRGLIPPLTITTEHFERTRTFAALLAYHTERRHRVQLGYLGGAAFLVREMRQTVSSSFPGLTPIVIPPEISFPSVGFESTFTDYGVTVEVGLDADIALSSRFSVVPQMRMLAFGGGLSLRPGAAFRATW